ncbi:MAG: hypothetical protein LC659_13650, partial [Myxococcales bacterium]|nr:hypothetical protein [Myxococcales bacterium]
MGGETKGSNSMGAQVLVVDDSSTIRSQLRLALRQAQDFDRFLEADNGLLAFKLMAEHRPDLV